MESEMHLHEETGSLQRGGWYGWLILDTAVESERSQMLVGLQERSPKLRNLSMTYERKTKTLGENRKYLPQSMQATYK